MDDMNMPRVDTYGTQQPIAMLKLLVENGGIYDRGLVTFPPRPPTLLLQICMFY